MKRLIVDEWLFFAAFILAILSSLLLKRVPQISKDEIEVLYLLFMFFISVKGLERSGFLKAAATWLQEGGLLSFKLVFGTFFLSLFITNDVALVTIVPLTLALNVKNLDKLVILETIAANSAALFPFGSPQNLYIYWHYGIDFKEFVKVISPFVAVMVMFLFFVLKTISFKSKNKIKVTAFKKEGFYYFFSFYWLC